MLAPETKKLFNKSRIIANRLFNEVSKIKNFKPFETSKFSLIPYGLALSVNNTAYKGHIFITEDIHRNVKVFFSPEGQNPLYVRTSLDYLAIFTKLLERKEQQSENIRRL